MRLHKHHIKPKYMGGTDDPSNLVCLSIEDHALAHKELWEKYGNWRDKLAWMGLSNMIERQELIHQILSLAGKEGLSRRKSTNKGKSHKKYKRNNSGTQGLKWYHNSLNPKEKGCFGNNADIPDGWIRGQGKKSVNPGINFTKNRLRSNQN